MSMAEDFNQSIDLIPEDDADFTISNPITENSISGIGINPYEDAVFAVDPEESNLMTEEQTGTDLRVADLGAVIEELKIIEQNQVNILADNQQIHCCIAIFIGLLIGQIFMLGLWRARRRG